MARGKQRKQESGIEEVAKKIGVRRLTRSTKRVLTEDMLVPTGSTMLNLAMSDTTFGGPKLGTMINVIGDSNAGKSFKEITMLVEACVQSRFVDYKMIYDDSEEANSFDMGHLFGKKAAKRITSPEEDEEGAPVNSHFIEDFNNNLMNLFEAGQQFIYVQDSFDSLDTEADDKKTEELRTARNKGNQSKGTYGMAKAKLASQYLRKICSELKKSKSLLSIVSQTRDDISLTYSAKTRSGGTALKFYAHHEMWLAVISKIMKTVKGKQRCIGVNCGIKITKNKLTGKVREIQVPIYYDYGIDNIGSCIDWLLKEDCWGGGGLKKINTRNTFSLDGMTRDKMIKGIEENGLQNELEELVGVSWKALEDSLRLDRKPKYE